MKIIYIDLDGTILDVSERVYRVYCDILKKHKKRILRKSRYLRLKKEKTPIETILRETMAEDILSEYKREWAKLIESPYYLEMDRLTQRKKLILLSLKNNYNLVLITLRNNRRGLYRQLEKEKIDKIFNDVLVPKRKDLLCPKWEIKAKTLEKYKRIKKDSIIVGDSEIDILAGKYLGIKTVAVIDGMRNKEFLKKYKPDFLISDFSKIKKVVNYEVKKNTRKK